MNRLSRVYNRSLKFSMRFIDSYKMPQYSEQPSILQMAYHTLCYRLAANKVYVRRNEKILSRFHHKHAGERAFIIGNGPSLNECDLTELRNETTFGVNSIFLNYDKMGFSPTYYVVEDVLVAEDRASEINRYDKSVKFMGNALSYCLEDSPETLWLNVLYRYQEYKDFPKFSTNALRKLWVGGTVTYLCLQLAYYMGFSKIYLVGFDHHYDIPDDAEVKGNRIKSVGDDQNHFNRDYFGKGYRWHNPRVDRMELAYMKARQYFEADGREIMNATVGGCLEVFPRVSYADLF